MTTEKPISVQELKTFIDAVEFASDKEDWIPSERQWKRIRSMIDRLEATQPQSVRAESAPMHMPMPMHMPPGAMPEPPIMAAPSAMTPMRMPQQMQPTAPTLSGPFATGGPTPVRTPDLDTSSGQYRSAYA